MNISLSRALIAGIAMLQMAGNLFALDPGKAVWQYVRDQWDFDKGFPGGQIHAMAQTQDGYLWIGTDVGLIRFDGRTFTLVRDSGPNAFPINPVLGLVADPDGGLWVRLSDPTLLRFRGGVFTAVTLNSLRRDSLVTAIARANDGRLLLASRKDGVTSQGGNGFKILAPAASLSGSPIVSMAEAAPHDLFLGTQDAGLIHMNDREISTLTQSLPALKINCLLALANGDLLVGTDGGMVRWTAGRITKAGIPGVLEHAAVLSLTKDRDSNIWIGTARDGLLRLNRDGVSSLAEGGTNAAVYVTFEDREGNLWTGSSKGIERLRDGAFVTYSASRGLPDENKGPIYAGSHGRIWWAPVAGGLYSLNDGKVEHLREAGLDRDVIYSISGRGSDLWLGRQRGGLTHLSSDGSSVKAKTYTQADGLGQDTVNSVHQNRDGSVWAGTLTAGVSHLHEGRFDNYNHANGLAADTVFSIAEGADGTMWFATPSGLSSFAQGRWKTYGVKDGLPSEIVYSLLADSRGNLWVGTLHGIAYISAGRAVIPAGLPTPLREPVFGMAEDRTGSLWIVTSNAVLRVEGNRLAHGSLAEGDVREYGLADGLPDMRGVRRDRSVVTDSSGQVWISRNGGVSAINPVRQNVAAAATLVHIAAFSVDGDPVDAARPILVPSGRKRIVVKYAGLNLSAPNRVLFRFRLDGFDPAWSPAAIESEAVYTNLSPGSYRFHVIASNADGVWNGREAVIPFDVDPAPWQTWWFRICVVLIVGSIAAGAYRWRLRQITIAVNLRFDERLAERTRLARELHDTLLQTIQGSKLVADDALDTAGEERDLIRMRAALQKVSVWLGQATDEGRAALNSLRSSTSQGNDLAKALGQAVADCTPQGSMSVDFSVEGTATDMHPIVRDEIFRIGYEAIRNACRHSGGTRLEVELQYAKNVALRVRDNGKGISREIAAQGKEGHFGLKGMHERAERIGSQLNLFNLAGSGTEVELIVPGHIVFQGESRRLSGRVRKLFGKTKRLPEIH